MCARPTCGDLGARLDVVKIDVEDLRFDDHEQVGDADSCCSTRTSPSASADDLRSRARRDAQPSAEVTARSAARENRSSWWPCTRESGSRAISHHTDAVQRVTPDRRGRACRCHTRRRHVEAFVQDCIVGVDERVAMGQSGRSCGCTPRGRRCLQENRGRDDDCDKTALTACACGARLCGSEGSRAGGSGKIEEITSRSCAPAACQRGARARA